MPKKGLMRNLGQFVGHVVKGITSDPAPARPSKDAAPPNTTPPTNEAIESSPGVPIEPAAQPGTPPDHPRAIATRQDVQEHTAETPVGRVTLRRTIIDEVRLEPPAGTPSDPSQPPEPPPYTPDQPA